MAFSSQKKKADAAESGEYAVGLEMEPGMGILSNRGADFLLAGF